MRIVITGAGGNIGRGIAARLRTAGHDLVLSDLPGTPDLDPAAESVPADVRDPGALDAALAGADLLVHLPAFHGVHVAGHSEQEFWRLNIDGTWNALQAAAQAGVRKALWLSSQAIHDPWGQYGFTKAIGEQLLEYHRRNHELSFVAIRPANLTPWTDFAHDYGLGLLTGRVDREDVLDAIEAGIRWLAEHEGELVIDATVPDSFTDDDLAGWSADPVGTIDRVFPGAREQIERFGLAVPPDAPHRPNTGGRAESGYAPTRHFGAWVAEVAGLTDDEVRTRTSVYGAGPL
jgi:nucleoside-diphosphate-sugar epimerase